MNHSLNELTESVKPVILIEQMNYLFNGKVILTFSDVHLELQQILGTEGFET